MFLALPVTSILIIKYDFLWLWVWASPSKEGEVCVLSLCVTTEAECTNIWFGQCFYCMSEMNVTFFTVIHPLCCSTKKHDNPFCDGNPPTQMEDQKSPVSCFDSLVNLLAQSRPQDLGLSAEQLCQVLPWDFQRATECRDDSAHIKQGPGIGYRARRPLPQF